MKTTIGMRKGFELRRGAACVAVKAPVGARRAFADDEHQRARSGLSARDESLCKRKLFRSFSFCVHPFALKRADCLLPMGPEPEGIVGSPGRLGKTQNGSSRQKEKQNAPADPKRAPRQRFTGTAAKKQKNTERADAGCKTSPEKDFAPERFGEFEGFLKTGVGDGFENEGRHRLGRIDTPQKKANACIC